jgi:hypothetical protein
MPTNGNDADHASWGPDHAEWGADYDGVSDVKRPDKPPPQPPAEPPIQKPAASEQQPGILSGSYQYIGHRTTKQGRLVLEFVHEQTGQIACRFFNVDTKSSRNGQMYRAGEGGQFTTRKGHRFRRFWLYAIGNPPFRWSRVHLELHKLKAVPFTGIAEQRHTANRSYWNLTELRKQR